MCQGEAEGLPNSSEHCQVQKVASLLAQALIDVDDASSGLMGVNKFGEALLSLDVAGTKPYMNMRVELEPLTYVTRPEYWGIEVARAGREVEDPP